METVEVTATREIMVPAGIMQQGETFSTTAAHAAELKGLGLVTDPKPARAAAKKAD